MNFENELNLQTQTQHAIMNAPASASWLAGEQTGVRRLARGHLSTLTAGVRGRSPRIQGSLTLHSADDCSNPGATMPAPRLRTQIEKKKTQLQQQKYVLVFFFFCVEDEEQCWESALLGIFYCSPHASSWFTCPFTWHGTIEPWALIIYNQPIAAILVFFCAFSSFNMRTWQDGPRWSKGCWVLSSLVEQTHNSLCIRGWGRIHSRCSLQDKSHSDKSQPSILCGRASRSLNQKPHNNQLEGLSGNIL